MKTTTTYDSILKRNLIVCKECGEKIVGSAYSTTKGFVHWECLNVKGK